MSEKGREPTREERQWLDALGKADDRYNSLASEGVYDCSIRDDTTYRNLKEGADRLEPKD